MNRLFPYAVLLLVGVAHPQTAGFRWASQQQSPKVFNEVKAAFAHELRKERIAGSASQGPAVLYTDTLSRPVSHLEKVGTFGTSAIVIIRYKKSDDDPYPWYKIFNLNLKTKVKSMISHEHGG